MIAKVADSIAMVTVEDPTDEPFEGRYPIPEGVTYIGEQAFSGCISLPDVTIPGSVSEIGEYAFSFCKPFMEIRFAGSKEQWAAVTKAKTWRSCTLFCKERMLR